MTSGLRWAAMRAILMFRNCEGQSHKTVSSDHNFRRDRRAEAESNRGPSAYQSNALPLGQTGSHPEGGIARCPYPISSEPVPRRTQKSSSPLIKPNTFDWRAFNV